MLTNLTPFQQEYAAQIEQDPDFDQWCLDPAVMVAGPNYSGVRRPKLFVYYTKDGRLHADRLADNELISRITFPIAEVGSDATSTPEDKVEGR